MPARRSRTFRIILYLFYVTFAAVFIYYFIDGWSYYSADLIERPRLENHANLKPGGLRGHGLGIGQGSVRTCSHTVFQGDEQI